MTFSESLLYHASMARKNHGKSLSAPERSLWSKVLVADLRREGRTCSVEKRACDLADLMVRRYRERITWGQS